MTYFEVAIAKNRSGGRFYTYSSSEIIKPGDIVNVQYGRVFADAIVINIVKKPTFATKEIRFKYPYYLKESSLNLLLWMVDFYPDDIGSICNLLTPPSLVKKPRESTYNPIIGSNQKLPIATKEQQQALDIILKKESSRVLLHGDTGTGKTRVFIEVINKILLQNESVLLLTPEIGLTPQLVTEVAAHTNVPIITYHSNLGPTERRNIWDYISKSTAPNLLASFQSWASRFVAIVWYIWLFVQFVSNSVSN